MPRTPLAVSVSPVKFILPRGVLNATEHVTVTNAGVDPITVHSVPMTVLQAAGGCGVAGAPDWVKVSSIGRLVPGQSRTATITVHAPAGTDADVAAVFTAVGKSSHLHSGGTLEASVGSQIVVNATGTRTAPECSRGHPRSLPHAAGSGLPVLPVALAAGLVLAAIAVIVVLTLRRRRPRARSARHS